MGGLLDTLASDGAVTAAVFGIFIALAALGLALRAVLAGGDPVSERLRAFGVTTAAPAMLQRGQMGAVAKGLSPLARIAAPDTEADRSQLRLRMLQAGFKGRQAVPIFLGTKSLLAVVIPLVFLALNTRAQWTTSLTTPVAMWLAIAGFLLPNLVLSRIIGKRQQTLRQDIPDAMDLLVTCVEAGLGLDAALTRVAGELTLSAPELSSELRSVLMEMGAGLARGEAFRRLAERTGIDDLRSLASTLTQADVFGTSISEALRNQAEWMRVRRMQRAEERAATVAVKMTIPLIFCILPSLIGVVMAPAAVRVAKSLMPGLAGE